MHCANAEVDIPAGSVKRGRIYLRCYDEHSFRVSIAFFDSLFVKSKKSKMQTLRRVCISLFSLVEIVSLLEFVDASTGVNKFLFAREVRMAL